MLSFSPPLCPLISSSSLLTRGLVSPGPSAPEGLSLYLLADSARGKIHRCWSGSQYARRFQLFFALAVSAFSLTLLALSVMLFYLVFVWYVLFSSFWWKEKRFWSPDPLLRHPCRLSCPHKSTTLVTIYGIIVHDVFLLSVYSLLQQRGDCTSVFFPSLESIFVAIHGRIPGLASTSFLVNFYQAFLIFFFFLKDRERSRIFDLPLNFSQPSTVFILRVGNFFFCSLLLGTLPCHSYWQNKASQGARNPIVCST